MKKSVVVAFVVLLAACQQNKIGYVDNVKLMDGYKEKMDIEANFKTKAEALTKKRDSISQAFQMEFQTFQIKAQKMAKSKAEEEYGLIQQRGQVIGQQLQQEEQQMQTMGQVEMDSLVNKVKREIKAYGKANGYTYILGGGDGGGVLYGTEGQDLTSKMLEILNDSYKK